jgi:polyphosphate kinase
MDSSRKPAVSERRSGLDRRSEPRNKYQATPRRPLRMLPPREADATDLKNPALYINRELSWLEFNERVLAQARDASHPLLERVKFLAINASNLDEFFMIRVSAALKKLREGVDDVAPDGCNTERELEAMRARARKMLQDQNETWESLRALLRSEQIVFLDFDDWTPEIRQYLADHFVREICPVLTPLAFDSGHPSPSISNPSKTFAVMLEHGGRTKFARVKVPNVLPRFVPIPDSLGQTRGLTFVFLEDVIRANIAELFAGTEIQGAYLFRIVRDADLEIEQELGDPLETVDRSLKQLRHGAVALIQVGEDMPTRVLNILTENFAVADDVVMRTPNRVGFADWAQLLRIHRPDLKDQPWVPRTAWRADEDPEVIFDQIRYQDVFVHHPYESFGSVETFLRAAVIDPHVVAIKMTLYRIGANAPLVNLLIEAAESGKQVVALVELKARRDEHNNIRWARRLESHGVNVVYGFADVKTHAKLCLVARQESDGMQLYVHTSSGNYNPETAKIYTDIGLFTADPDVASDVSTLFNHLTGYSHQKEFRRLLVAPEGLRSKLRDLILREVEHARAGRPARMIIKVNALTDDKMVRALYRASQAGVTIDLLVRGICCLRPDVPGISENIRVRSIVGRFLEHSRIYWFQNGGQEEMYVGSADLMERNLGRRVETLAPIRDQKILAHLRDVVLGAYLRDTARAMVLDSAGRYHRPDSETDRFDAQESLLTHYSGMQNLT